MSAKAWDRRRLNSRLRRNIKQNGYFDFGSEIVHLATVAGRLIVYTRNAAYAVKP